MKGDQIVSGLVRKRRQLGREIATHQSAIDRLRLDMAAVDQVLTLWRPEMDLDALVAFRTDNLGVKPGALSRPILAALRMASEPLSLTEIARYVIAVRGPAGEPMELYRKRVRRSLDSLRARGLVVGETCGGKSLWALVG